MVYVTESVAETVERAARHEGASTSAWAAAILEREAKRSLGAGEIPVAQLKRNRPKDPRGSVLRNLIDERRASR